MLGIYKKIHGGMAEDQWKKWEGELLNFHFKQSGHLGILIISGEVISKEEDNLQEALMVALDNVEHLLVYFEKLNNVTDSFIQILCSAYRHSTTAHKRLTLFGTQTDLLKKSIHKSGMINIPACIDDCYNKCLWV